MVLGFLTVSNDVGDQLSRAKDDKVTYLIGSVYSHKQPPS